MRPSKPWWVAVGCALAACATPEQAKVYGGTELEGSERSKADTDLHMNGVAGGVNSVKATADQGDLATSFEPEPSHDDADSDSEGESETAPPVAKVRTARDEKEAAFEQKRQKALKLAGQGKGDAALALGKELEAEAADLPPSRVAHALEVQARGALAQRDLEATRKATDAWLLSCGPDKVDGCRARAFWVLGRAAQIGKLPALKTKIDKLQEHDACVRKVEGGLGRAEGKAPDCLNDAMGAYRSTHDNLMQMRAQYARGVALAGKEPQRQAAIFAFARAEAMCKEPRCVSVRRKALRRLANLYTADGDLEKAAESALSEAHLFASTLADEVKVWGMTNEAQAACERYDAKAGAGSCRKLERQRFGGHVFFDFSQQKAKGQGGLSPADVKKVNAHYGVLVEQCLESEKTRMPPLTAYKYDVKWVVQNDGSVGKVEFGGDGRDESPLGHCIKDQFGNWRYPRYAGEFQHVAQSFTVSSRQQRR